MDSERQHPAQQPGFPELYLAAENDALELLHQRMEDEKLNAVGEE